MCFPALVFLCFDDLFEFAGQARGTSRREMASTGFSIAREDCAVLERFDLGFLYDDTSLAGRPVWGVGSGRKRKGVGSSIILNRRLSKRRLRHHRYKRMDRQATRTPTPAPIKAPVSVTVMFSLRWVDEGLLELEVLSILKTDQRKALNHDRKYALHDFDMRMSGFTGVNCSPRRYERNDEFASRLLRLRRPTYQARQRTQRSVGERQTTFARVQRKCFMHPKIARMGSSERQIRMSLVKREEIEY